MQWRRIFSCLVLYLLLAACASAPQTRSMIANKPPDLPSSSYIAGTAFFPQTLYQCGPAALATVLSATQLAVTPDELVPLVYVPGRTGSFQTEITATARSYGRLAYVLQPAMADLLREVAAGKPVLVLQNLGLSRLPQWHFAVVKGYDLQQQEMILNSGEIEDYRIGLSVFERTWARAGHWGLVVTAPDSSPITAEPGPYLQSLIDLQHSFPDLAAVESGYRHGLSRWPDNRSLRMGLGNLLLEQTRYDAAAKEYTAVLAQHAEYGPAHNNLAQALLELGDYEQALLHVQQALNLQDEFQQVYQRTLAEIQQRQQQAQQQQ